MTNKKLPTKITPIPPGTLPEVREIIEAVRVKMEKAGDSIQDVADFLDKDYQQLWDWLNYKKGTPKLQNLSLLKGYAEKKEPIRKVFT